MPLPCEPQLRPGLALVRQHLDRMRGKHLILDFTRVEIITSPSIGGLLLLRQVTSEWGGRLIFCSVRLVTKCILRTVGLDLCFEFAEDRSKALKALREPNETPAGASPVHP